jgi:hypothetical protein
MPDVVTRTTELLESLRASGALEGLFRFNYYAAASAARFDTVSHILPTFQVNSDCSNYAAEPREGCSAHFAGARTGEAESAGAESAAMDWLLGP